MKFEIGLGWNILLIRRIDPKLLDNYTRYGDCLFAQAIVGPKFEMFAESEKSFFVK